MTGAYAGILNGGSAVTPYGLLKLSLLGDDEPLMGIGGGIEERGIQESSARQLIWMMEKVVSQGTGKRAQFEGREIAGKTGTTQGAKDAWFIGFTGDYVAGVWLGYDDNTKLKGVTGGGLPADIWRETMQRVHIGVPIKPLPMQAPKQPQQVAQPTNVVPDNSSNNRNIIENLLFYLLGGNDR
jgi:membrane peptidoglycan carboxypeptidase